MTRGGWGRLLTVKGAMLVVVSFGLPAFHGCNEVRTPGTEVHRTIVHGWSAWVGLPAPDPQPIAHGSGGAPVQIISPSGGAIVAPGTFIFAEQRPYPHLKSLAVFVLPYLAALLVLVRLSLTDRGKHGHAHALLFFFLMFAFVCFEFGYGGEFLKRLKYRGTDAFVTNEFFAMIGPLPLVGLFLGLRHRARGHAHAAWVCQLALAIALAGYFLVYTVLMLTDFMGFAPLYGLYFADAGGLLLVAGTVLEGLHARALRLRPESVDPRAKAGL